MLLHGPAGIGKSTVLRALAAEYGETARTVLRCSATESESHLPFLALADLLGLVLDEVSERLPAAQRTALESALTGRGESSSSATDSPCASPSCPRCAPSRPTVPSSS